MWSPKTTEVEPNEMLGRRAYGDFSPGQKSGDQFFKYRTKMFVDTRLGNDLSLDRLGKGTYQKEVVSFLTPLANQQKADFRGWAQFRYSDLEKYAFLVRPTPQDEPNNPYHADLDRSKHRTRQQAELLGFALAGVASLHNFVEKAA